LCRQERHALRHRFSVYGRKGQPLQPELQARHPGGKREGRQGALLHPAASAQKPEMAAAHRRDCGPERQRLCRFRRPDGREEVREELTGNAAAPRSVPRSLTCHDARRKTTSTVMRLTRRVAAAVFWGVKVGSCGYLPKILGDSLLIVSSCRANAIRLRQKNFGGRQQPDDVRLELFPDFLERCRLKWAEYAKAGIVQKYVN